MRWPPPLAQRAPKSSSLAQWTERKKTAAGGPVLVPKPSLLASRAPNAFAAVVAEAPGALRFVASSLR